MAVEDADVMIVMKPFSEWTSASSRAEMVEKASTRLMSFYAASVACAQSDIKRVLAFSTISQIGFILWPYLFYRSGSSSSGSFDAGYLQP